MGTRTAIYTRISADSERKGLGVGRQRDACAAKAAAKGWTVSHVYIENDTSAYSGKQRPQYQLLCRALRAGEYDAVLAWADDRLHRSAKELEAFLDIVEPAGVHVETLHGGPWGFGAGDLLKARIAGAIAQYESQLKSERVRSELEESAAMGKSHGRIPYGWQAGRDAEGNRYDVKDREQAAVVVALAEGLIARKSISEMVRDLNGRGVSAPTDRPWTRSTVRALLERADRNTGFRVHKGQRSVGRWDPILTQEMQDDVTRVLADETRRTSAGTKAAHLLSGIMHCAVCEAAGGESRVWVGKAASGLVYRCSAGHVGRKVSDVDAWVREVMVAYLGRPDIVDVLTPPERRSEVQAAQADVEKLTTRRKGWLRLLETGAMSDEEFAELSANTRPVLDDAKRRASVVDNSAVFGGVIGADDVPAAWDALPLGARRTIVALLVELRLHKGVKGAQSFDRETVEIIRK